MTFTLKLFKGQNGQLVTDISSVDRVQTMDIGTTGRMIELWAFKRAPRPPFHPEQPPEVGGYDVYYIGDREPQMDAVNETNHWQWGLLENEAGRTTQHFRPASYGIPR